MENRGRIKNWSNTDPEEWSGDEEAGSGKDLSSLSLATAFGSHIATTARSEASTTVTLETTATLATSTVSTTAARTTTAGAVAVATVGVATRPALLDDDLLTTHLMRIGSDSGSVARGLSKLNKSTVLEQSTS